mmetsp:Transcript_43634/g.98160  ORF Transcript_43634/g.98160 Transcript_43634/m.98160 type:complete len:151 (-) Transcript_43634:276-728(-)
MHYGNKPKEEAGQGAVEARGRVVAQPGDGSCLFHSLSFGLGGVSAQGLRREVADYVAGHPRTEIVGVPISDWVLWDSGLTPKAYADRMRTGSHWGGAIEMAVVALIKGVPVGVYEGRGGRFERISYFEGAGKEVSVVYGGRVHYDALVLQ